VSEQVAPILLKQIPHQTPRWVWSIVIVYLVLGLGVLLVPMWMALELPHEMAVVLMVSLIVGLLVLCGIGLLMTPVRQLRQRPMSRKSFLIPLLASGLLFGGLILSAGLALAEAAQSDIAIYAACGGGAVAWIAWAIVFWVATRSLDPLSVASRFHHWLIGGSVVELLVAVPCHVIVRRRNDCCGGIMTGTAICLGAMVLFVAFGPSVLMLYWRRSRELRKPV